MNNKLYYRLLGVIVSVSLAIIILPYFLDGKKNKKK